jgi:uncharacterized glyoxalase superfamily protein PhnB
MVEEADRWWDHFPQIGLAEKYPHIMLKPPQLQPWGLRILYLSDLTGVLWYIADRKKDLAFIWGAGATRRRNG